MQRLTCVSQGYEWGKPGATSAVARLLTAAQGAAVAPAALAQPFAELWMGTHPSGAARLAATGEPLQQALLRGGAAALGVAPYSATTGALPFLLKVLSIAKALSVQAHPDAALARRLHAERPAVYKDGNHKPEMAVALTPFEAMCSFRPPAEVAAHARGVPELRALLGGDEAAERLARAADAAASGAGGAGAAAAFSAELREAYACLMGQPDAVVQAQVALLAARLSAAPAPASAPAPSGGEDLFTSLSADAAALRLCGDFPGDVGCLSPYLLNVVRLSPGEAIFLGANEPHAYLSGDCVEVMACSDNVVRAGLTPKYKDVSTLVGMLTYIAGRPAVLRGTAVGAHVREYVAPVPEFLLQRTELAEPGARATMPPTPSAALLIVVSGTGTARTASAGAAEEHALHEGQVWLQPFGVGLELEGGAAVGAAPLIVFRAHTARDYVVVAAAET